MPLFSYKARDRTGRLVTGIKEETSITAMENSLDDEGLIPINIQESTPAFNLSKLNWYFQKIRPEDMIVFTRQLATLFSAGIPFLKSLETLAKQAVNPLMQEVIGNIKIDVEGGLSFANALRKHPDIFSELYVNMIAAGEEGGVLDEVLLRLALMAEREEDIRSQVKSSTMYPKIVIAAIFVAIFVMLYFVVPRFSVLYAKFGAQLPLPTRILIGMSDFFKRYWYYIAGAMAASYVVFKEYLKTGKGRYWWHNVILYAPVFGNLNLKVAMSRFARMLGTLFRSGIPILQAIDVVSSAIGNDVIADVLMQVRQDVQSGAELSSAMQKFPLFPPIILQMIEIGEESGKLDEMLVKVSEYFDQEVEYGIKRLITALEPMLIGFIFIIVLLLALAVFLPMWDIVKFTRH